MEYVPVEQALGLTRRETGARKSEVEPAVASMILGIRYRGAE